MSTKVKFVITEDGEKELMLKAAQAVQSAHLPTEKVSSSDVLQLDKRDKHLYVCVSFRGEAFSHLCRCKCRVVGPQCVLSCLELQVAVPNVSHPINNIAMQDVVVSCSSVEKARRERVHELLQWMGGRVSRDFTESVTHLVVGEVGSKKYHVAANLKKPIMLPDWVEAAWKESQDKVFHATSEDFVQEYKCPAFKGCIVCVTGLDATNKQEVRKRVEEHGGLYTGELKYNECTHLIVGVARGPKFEFARKWKIHTVSLQWFRDSIEAGYCLDEQLYTVQSQDQPTSTPVKDQKQQPRLSTALSNISAINMSCIQPVDDTAMPEPNITMDTSRIPVAPPQDELEVLDKLDLSTCPADLFLDGCKIFLSGFSGLRLEKLRKIVNAGGGTRFNQINENVSHIVIGNRINEHIEELKALSHRPVLVSALWLVECLKQSSHVGETSYLVQGIWEDEKDKENEVTFKLPSATNQQPKKLSRTSTRKKSDESKDEEDILSQYMPGASNAGAPSEDDDVTLVEEGDQSRRKSAGSRSRLDDETQIETDQGDGDEEDEVEEGGEKEEEGGAVSQSGIFAGKRFVVLGFTPDQEQLVCRMIPEQGGTVLPLTTRAIPDYAIVPIFGWEVNVTVNEIVTNCWLQMSLEAEEELDPSSNVLFTPVTLLKDAAPLSDCVLSISQYCYIERDCLLHIAELLGARCQEYFVRKATNNLEANTHLLLRDPEGTKYTAAKKWKVPAVTKEWLLACAKTGKKQPEKEYLVDIPMETLQPPRKEDAETVPAPPKTENRDSKRVVQPVERQQQVEEEDVSEPVQEEVQTEKTELSEKLSEGEKKAEDSGMKEEVPQTKASIQKKRVVLDVTPKQMTPSTPSTSHPIVNKNLQAAKAQTPGGTPARESTPSRILGPGFKPSFDLEEAVAALDSPGMASGRGKGRRKSSLPLDEFYHQNIANALQIRLGSTLGNGATNNEEQDDVFQEEEAAPGVLAGVVICVSKKLSRKQGDYNAIAMAIGAEYQWTYDEKCTHFIFQGKANDTAKDFRLARSQGKLIVSPHWLLACQEDNKRQDETLYPHTYNPKLSLSVMGSCSQTPVRSSRTRSAAAISTPLAPPPAPQPAPPPAPKPTLPTEQDRTSVQADTLSDEELLRAVEAEEPARTAPDGEGKTMNQDLQKHLDDIMSSSNMNLRGSRRRSRRPGNSTGGDNTPTADSSITGRKSSRLRTKRSTEKIQPPDSGKEIGLHVEASQSIQITWDDPTSRREKEKIMAQLKRSDNGLSDFQEPGEDAQYLEDKATKKRTSSTSGAPRPEPEDTPPTPTPKAPSIRLPLAKPAVAPQPREECMDDQQQEMSTGQARAPPKFLFTGMGQEEKIDYSALIEQLGGEVKDAQYFDASCTHIIVGNPTRNEKYLAALATGKWIMHKSYLEACRQAHSFVEEEPHEWGNRTDLSRLSETGKKMALAATRWRARIQDQEEGGGSSTGAFDGWRALLLVEKSKEMCFKRLLEAGGAKVLAVRPPFTAHLDASHAFFDLHKVKADADTVGLEELVQSGIMCLKPEYIADFLVHDPSPDPQNYIINEAKPILQKIVDQAANGAASSKRRASEMTMSPRTKRTRHR